MPLTVYAGVDFLKLVLRGIGHRDWPKKVITMPLCSRDFRDLTEISNKFLASCLGKTEDVELYDFKPTVREE
jgi:hypothetical protein